MLYFCRLDIVYALGYYCSKFFSAGEITVFISIKVNTSAADKNDWATIF
jgi:hypothetical protein